MPYPILFSAIETVVVFLHPFGDVCNSCVVSNFPLTIIGLDFISRLKPNLAAFR